MDNSLNKLFQGYQAFREKYAAGDSSVMQDLAHHGQKPEIMVIACCDSRVDPAVIFQCDPGDIFTVRNIANIVPPYQIGKTQPGTAAALEYGICYLKVKHLVILGHSQCGGMDALLNGTPEDQDDFISRWVSVIKKENHHACTDTFAKQALSQSYENCLTFPWINKKVERNALEIHRWFFDIKAGEIYAYSPIDQTYQVLK